MKHVETKQNQLKLIESQWAAIRNGPETPLTRLAYGSSGRKARHVNNSAYMRAIKEAKGA